jgi:acyl-CoA dehydrogenase
MSSSTATVTRPAPLKADDEQFLTLAAKVGEIAAATAEAHDRENTFVREAYDAMRETGYLTLAVPTDLGGLGATLRQAAYAQHELARFDGAAALASAMHTYLTFVQVFRRRNGAPDAEGVLRRVVDEGLVIATSGGSDWLWPNTIAVEDNGTLRVSGRKMFCSQAPAANVLATSAVLGEPGEGAEVVMFSMPLNAPGVTIVETWDTLGMRGTSSHDVVLDNVEVPVERIVARRPWGQFNPALLAAGIHIAPIIGAVYHGIANAARDEAVTRIAKATRGSNPAASLERVQRQVGLMDARLRTSWWALMGALEEMGDSYGADAQTANAIMLAKRDVVLAAREVTDLAMDAVGGASFFRNTPLERYARDVRAGTFHPFTPENTLTYAGRVALGQETMTE